MRKWFQNRKSKKDDERNNISFDDIFTESENSMSEEELNAERYKYLDKLYGKESPIIDINEHLNEIVLERNGYSVELYHAIIYYINNDLKKKIDGDIEELWNDEVLHFLMTVINYNEQHPHKMKSTCNYKELKGYIESQHPDIFEKIDSTYRKKLDKLSPDNLAEHLNAIGAFTYASGRILPYDFAKDIVKAAFRDYKKINKIALKSALISICHKKLERNNIDDVIVTYGSLSEKVEGEYYISSNDIILNDFVIDNLYSTLDSQIDFVTGFCLYPLSSVFHESEHAIQHKRMESPNDLSFTTMLFIKERLIYSIIPNYYDDNYFNIFAEIYARIAGKREAAKFVNELVPGINFDENQDYKNLILEDAKTLMDEAYTKKVFGRKANILEEFDFLMLFGKIDILSAFNKFPLLRLEYNFDGTKVEPTEMVKNALMMLNGYKDIPRKSQIYAYITSYLRTYDMSMNQINKLSKYITYDTILNAIIRNVSEEKRKELLEKSSSAKDFNLI